MDRQLALALEAAAALVAAGYDGYAVTPGEPARDLLEQVAAAPTALRVGPVAIGEHQDVHSARVVPLER